MLLYKVKSPLVLLPTKRSRYRQLVTGTHTQGPTLQLKKGPVPDLAKKQEKQNSKVPALQR